MLSRLIILALLLLGPAAALRAQPAAPLRETNLSRIMPPAPRTPVELFRQILEMNPAARQQALAGRSEQARAFLDAKLREFDALPPSGREERLQTLQLRWLLLPLMKKPAADRTSSLAALSPTDRALVEERLQEWDLLPEDLQRKVLENQNVIRIFLRPGADFARPDPGSTHLLPAQRAQMEQDQQRWLALAEEDRERILAQFDRFLELNAREKSRILDGMGEKERRQMQLTLQNFARLPREQRDACLRGFGKFRALSPQEREAFLSNAERWQAMSAADRQLWRDLVARLGPRAPLPPGARPKSAPLPPGAKSRPPPPQSAGRPPNLTTN